MSLPFLSPTAIGQTASRLGILLAVLALPLLAVPAGRAADGLLVGADIQRASGAGLVIVVGLQRAR